MRVRLAGCLLALLSACGGGGGGGSTDPGPVTPQVKFSLSGRAQKGPFAVGAQVTANELSDNLSANGKVYNAQTADNLGNFVFSSQLATRFVDITASGYYLDEITGRLSTSVIDLRATADLSVLPTPTVNALTSLQALRLKALMTQGQSFSAAYAQSQNEVLAAFGVDAAKVGGLTTLDAMRIDGSKDADAVLLAVSTTLAQMAADAAKANGSNPAAELSSLVNTMAAQIGTGGAVTSPAIVAARKLAQAEINASVVRSNVETYYSAQAAAMVAPKFEEWLDSSGSGVLPQRLAPVNGLVFTDVTAANPVALVTSNAITVAGLGAGVSVPVVVDADTTLIKNNAAVDGKRTVAQNGDTLALRVTSAGYAGTRTSTISVGASSSHWHVASAALSGTIGGLTGSGMVLQLNSAETLTLAAGATSFAFASPLAVGAQFSIKVLTPPTGQTCGVANGNGTVGPATAAVSISCVTAGAASIAKVSGDLRTIGQHQWMPGAPRVLVLDGLNNPVAEATVVFQASSGYYAAHPMTVTTGPDGIAFPGINGQPFELYFHVAGAQSMTASLAGGDSVKFDVTVTPSTHAYDGKYVCTGLASGQYGATENFFGIADGQSSYQVGSSTFNEAGGNLQILVGANYKAHWFGQIGVDAAGQATLTGSYTDFSFAGQSADPIGTWSCYRW